MHARPAAPTIDSLDETELSPLALADSLARTALECTRQHERLAKLVAHRVPRAERRFGERMVELADEALRSALLTFERDCDRQTLDEDVRQRANAVWMAAREFHRRQRVSDDDSRQFTQHSADHLTVLRTEYELEASALLALRHATRDFAKLRGDDV
ncbi:MAG: hypothetical protein MUF00_09810 [Gemmatimonadaceae bacterium]|nr:hypothetical protein [Gemmatimonadaceae bacterium]